MSLANDILQLVEDTAVRDGFSRVARLRLEAGALAGVEVQALRFALEAISPGTCLAGAQITIDEPDAQAWCSACQHSVTIRSRLAACPACGGYALRPTSGTGLTLRDIVVHDD